MYLTTSIYPITVSNSPVAASRRSLIIVFPEPGNPANPVLVKKKSTRDENICQLEKIAWRRLALDWWSKDQSSSELRAHRDKPGIRIEISLKLIQKIRTENVHLSLHKSFFRDHAVGENPTESRMSLLKYFF